MKHIATLGILAGGLGIAALFGTGTAQADTHIWVGGNDDCNSSLFINSEKAAGQYNPNDNNIAVTYPVDCPSPKHFLVIDPTYGPRLQGGVIEAQKAWDANCANTSDKCILEGGSLGSGVVAIVGNNVGADKPGSNTHVITDINPWGATGFAGDNRGPLLNAIDVGIRFPVDITQVPGSESRLELWDFISDGAKQTFPVDLNMYNHLGTNHTLPIGDPVQTFVTDDGVTQEVFEQGTPVPHVIDPADNPAIPKG